jgi:hypothetical protein
MISLTKDIGEDLRMFSHSFCPVIARATVENLAEMESKGDAGLVNPDTIRAE